MRKIALLTLTFVLMAGLGAGWVAWMLQQRLEAVLAAEHDLSGHLDRMVAIVGEVTTSQQAYVVPGQPSEPWLERVSALLGQLTAETEGLRSSTQSPEAIERLGTLSEATAAMSRADASARENLRVGQDLMAADVILGEGRTTARSILEQVTGLRAQGIKASGAERATLWQQIWLLLGGTGLLWIVGILAAIFAFRRTQPATPAVLDSVPVAPLAPVLKPSAPAITPAPAVDLTTTAEICTDIARLRTPEGLVSLLARTAALIDASGIILWMASGEELIAATAHGYDPRWVSRLPRIDRAADNATAAAWRTGQMGTVASDQSSNGAVVVPLFAADYCLGVLAAEVRHARENDAAIRAVTAMIAAQLATVIATLTTAAQKEDRRARAETQTSTDEAPPLEASAIA